MEILDIRPLRCRCLSRENRTGQEKYLNKTNANQGESVLIIGRAPDFRMWESCRTMPLVGSFSRGSPVSPASSFRRCSILTSIILIGSQDVGKSGGNGRSPRKPADQRHRLARIPLAINPVTRPGIEPGSPSWEASRLTAQLPWPQALKTSLRATQISQFNSNFQHTLGLRSNSRLAREQEANPVLSNEATANEQTSEGSHNELKVNYLILEQQATISFEMKFSFVWTFSIRQSESWAGFLIRFRAGIGTFREFISGQERRKTRVDFAIGSQFIRRALDDYEPIADLQGNKGDLRLHSDELSSLRLDSGDARKHLTWVCRTYPKVINTILHYPHRSSAILLSNPPLQSSRILRNPHQSSPILANPQHFSSSILTNPQQLSIILRNPYQSSAILHNPNQSLAFLIIITRQPTAFLIHSSPSILTNPQQSSTILNKPNQEYISAILISSPQQFSAVLTSSPLQYSETKPFLINLY
ncbi:hypothetical protein PR048_012100 [Dryococelus australis]|uniref:Uncharacterized protein n=1 Tax=Dryococelus australis TaxID=614101 RepID=A0ABQ9HP23_9NEOP|nr:hypothetical protein PR048_012100 [Dryococelus australis]